MQNISTFAKQSMVVYVLVAVCKKANARQPAKHKQPKMNFRKHFASLRYPAFGKILTLSVEMNILQNQSKSIFSRLKNVHLS
jgi:hypothetical protein